MVWNQRRNWLRINWDFLAITITIVANLQTFTVFELWLWVSIIWHIYFAKIYFCIWEWFFYFAWWYWQAYLGWDKVLFHFLPYHSIFVMSDPWYSLVNFWVMWKKNAMTSQLIFVSFQVLISSPPNWFLIGGRGPCSHEWRPIRYRHLFLSSEICFCVLSFIAKG